MEAYVSMDRTSFNLASMLGGVAIYDNRYNYPAFVLGLNSAGVIWRTSIVRNVPLNNLSYPTVFSQTNALPNPNLLSVYLRIVYSGGIFTPMFRQSLTASWTPVFAVGQSTIYGGAISEKDISFGWAVNNWGGRRALFFLNYIVVGSATCISPGCTRTVGPGTNPAVLSGLSSATSYTVVVAGVSQYGVGGFTPASLPFTTPAAPADALLPVINVALNKPATSPVSYQYSAATPASLITDGFTITNEVSSACGAGLWCCLDSNGVSPWAMIDLGKPSDIQSMTIWARSDNACTNQFGQVISCASRTNG